MDWMRKKAARLGAEFRNASLAKSLFFYMAAGAVAGMMLWILSRSLCGSWFKVFTGDNLWENLTLRWEIAHEEKGKAAMRFLWFWYWYGQYPCLAACCTAAGGMFLRKRIYPALKAVQDAFGRIGAGDYGKEITYLDGDEMGRLCRSFEQLRGKLVKAEMLEKVNLLDQKNIRVKAMSGGMKRRLGIAQAIIHDPKVIIVDEPTAGLDPEERVRFRNLLCEIARERIVLLSTHIVGDIEAACEEIAVLNRGEVVFRGTVESLLKLVENKVYSAEVSARELDGLKERFIVTGILNTGSTATVRIIAESMPLAEAKPCSADVEDAYMFLMHSISAPLEEKGSEQA